jgi:hypothetical protein
VDVSGIPVRRGVVLSTVSDALAGVGIEALLDEGFSSRTDHSAFKNNNYTATHNVVSLTVVNNDNLWYVIGGDTAIHIDGERLGVQLNHTATKSSEYSCQVGRWPLTSRLPSEPSSVMLAALWAVGWRQEDVAQYMARTIRCATGLGIINVTFTTTTRLTASHRPAAIAFWDYRAQIFLHFATQEDLDAYLLLNSQTPLSLNFAQPNTPELFVSVAPVPPFRSNPTSFSRSTERPGNRTGVLVRRASESSTALALLGDRGRVMSTLKAYDDRLNSLSIELKAVKSHAFQNNASFSSKLTSLESSLESLNGSVATSTMGYERLEAKIDHLLQAFVRPSSSLSPTDNSHAA